MPFRRFSLLDAAALLISAIAVAGCRVGGSQPPAGASDLATTSEQTAPYILVLGVGQDGGVPQAGSVYDPRWRDASARKRVASLAIVDPRASAYWIVDATPDFPEQMTMAALSSGDSLKLGGVLLTHAHIGHYTGLMYLGHEAMGARQVPVYAMPRMAAFLSDNGPWDQLVRYHNIRVSRLTADSTQQLSTTVSVSPFIVPHRQEYSEVVGYKINLGSGSALYVPDIDSWNELDDLGRSIERLIADVDVAFLDATFFDNGELPGRDMSGFPHPFVRVSMDRFDSLPESERRKIRFIHLNHSNPALSSDSEARREIVARGYSVAERGDRVMF